MVIDICVSLNLTEIAHVENQNGNQKLIKSMCSFIELPKIRRPNRDFHKSVDRSFSAPLFYKCSSTMVRLQLIPIQMLIMFLIRIIIFRFTYKFSEL